ncbi:hypothetical protein K3181_01905 [Qipengyuania sp. YG27]|uniref:GAF domain-containing protein n=1 Tax=Qipengyuania mesophila TaxID=2867246 RepID=A0ABS7JRC5_9SPHN|nr:hypothetical protein [Qipengyuania mesophila]MBX7500197.1 hypothetical protein [Qipengyuania mesophila]
MSAIALARIRPLWFLALAAAILLDIFGTLYVLRDAYDRDTAFAAVNLISQVENDGSATVETLVRQPGKPVVAAGSRIVAIDGKALPRNARIADAAEAIAAAGAAPTITFSDADGTLRSQVIEKSPRYAQETRKHEVLRRDTRMGLRMAVSLLTCLVLIACAALLVLRRPRDPVCLMFSFSFLLFAATIDPPMLMWLGLGLGGWYDLVSTAAWVLLVIGIAIFPDGRFEPGWARWLIVVAPLAGVLLSIEEFPLLASAVIAFILPLALLLGTATKYRHFEPGIERQQLKWAGIGFATGLVSVAIAFVMVVVDAYPSGPWQPIYGLGVLAFFDLGFMLLALGLMIALIRYRLWEADRVIGRSAIMAGVALVIGILWAASIDLVKNAIEMALGEDNKTFATALCAVLAAGLFAPTQQFVVKHTRNRFDRDRGKISALLGKLSAWRASEDPDEIAMRALAALAPAVHFGSAAVLVDRKLGRELLAVRDVADPETLTEPGSDLTIDPRFVWRFPLADEHGPLGLLLIGPRSDANRYNEDELANIERVAEPLAEALRSALKRREQQDRVRRELGAMEERLARLEGGPPGAAPA